MKFPALVLIAMALAACGQPDSGPVVEEAADSPAPTASVAPKSDPADRLSRILDAQPDKTKARYGARNPAETLAFFGIEPGMQVGEALPGGGWYSKILLAYLGSEGGLHGLDYPLALWAKFSFMTPEALEKKGLWTVEWPEKAAEWVETDAAAISAYNFGNIPDSAHGQLDAVLMIRSLHNLSRFNADGGFLETAASDSFNLLKPGGVLGVVQHHVGEDASDEYANGDNGYLKESAVKSTFLAAGFEFVKSSDINANPADKPGEGDVVWRLPPSLGDSAENPERREAMIAIGESNRMTLLFRKPATG